MLPNPSGNVNTYAHYQDQTLANSVESTDDAETIATIARLAQELKDKGVFPRERAVQIL